MRTQNELRRLHGIPIPKKGDSDYQKKAQRADKKFAPLKIPDSLSAALPFKAYVEGWDHRLRRSGTRNPPVFFLALRNPREELPVISGVGRRFQRFIMPVRCLLQSPVLANAAYSARTAHALCSHCERSAWPQTPVWTV